MSRVLIAGIGNILRGDDGFGPAVIEALRKLDDVGSARIADVGIGGIALVQELFDGYDALIAVDCMRRGGAPGSLYVLEARVPPIDAIDEEDRVALAADMHDIGPDRALVVARAAGVLPDRVWLVGCEPSNVDEMLMNLSAPVQAALQPAIDAVRALVGQTAERVAAEDDGQR
jgi:hydrogenase maturation protease